MSCTYCGGLHDRGECDIIAEQVKQAEKSDQEKEAEVRGHVRKGEETTHVRRRVLPLILATLLIGCGGPPFTIQDGLVIMTDASSESAPFGSYPDSSQEEQSIQGDGAILPEGADSGDASADHVGPTPERDAGGDLWADSSRDACSGECYDASPDYYAPDAPTHDAQVDAPVQLCCNWGPVFGCSASAKCGAGASCSGTSCNLANSCSSGNPQVQGVIGVCP